MQEAKLHMVVEAVAKAEALQACQKRSRDIKKRRLKLARRKKRLDSSSIHLFSSQRILGRHTTDKEIISLRLARGMLLAIDLQVGSVILKAKSCHHLKN